MGLPSYLTLRIEGILRQKLDKALALREFCRLCPRACEVERLDDEKGFCQAGRKARIASYNAHFGEEAPIMNQYRPCCAAQGDEIIWRRLNTVGYRKTLEGAEEDGPMRLGNRDRPRIIFRF